MSDANDGTDWSNLSAEVDEFLRDVLSSRGTSVPAALDAAWTSALTAVTSRIETLEHSAVVLADSPTGEVHVQIGRQEDVILVEAVSNEFLKPDAVVRPDEVRTLVEMGWDPPGGGYFQNFFRFYSTDDRAVEIARFLVLTLRDAYDADPATVLPALQPVPEFPPAELLAAIDPQVREKVAHAPELFGFTPAVAAAAVELIREGAVVRHVEHDGARYGYMGHRVFITQAEDADRVVVTLQLTELESCAQLLECLARIDVYGHDRLVTDTDGKLNVQLERRLPTSGDPPAAVIWINQTLDLYADALYFEVSALPDLVEKFAHAGLGIPYIPTTLRDQLYSMDDWWWATDDSPQPDDDYMLASVEWLQEPVEDHVSVSHAGHGVNSYALTWRLAIGPIAMLIQAPWGGFYSDDASDVGRQAAVFRRASILVKELEERGLQDADGPKRRRVLLVASLLRGGTCQVWDDLGQQWLPAANLPAEADNFSPSSDWWKAVRSLIVDASEGP